MRVVPAGAAAPFTTSALGTGEGLKDGLSVFAGTFHDPDGPFERAFAPLDDLRDEELKQGVSDVLGGHPSPKVVQAPTMLLRINGQKVAVGIGIVDDPGEVEGPPYGRSV